MMVLPLTPPVKKPKARQTKQPTIQDYFNAFKQLGYIFSYNEVTGLNEVNGEVIDSRKESEIICKMHDLGFHLENRIIHQINYAANLNRYHPIKAYLEALPKWDSFDHIDHLCQYIKADSLFHIFLHRFAVSCVGKVYKQTQSNMLVLNGGQGIGKSCLVKSLVPAQWLPYYAEGELKPDQKDTKFRVTSTVLWEVNELGSTTRRQDRESLKGLLTQTYITERRAYGRQDEKRPILANFIGTINNGSAGFLNDPSGNRRFMITTIHSIDWKGYTADWSVDGFWSQAYYEWLSGEPTDLTPNELKLSLANNDNYTVPDPIETAFEDSFIVDQSNNFTSTIEILDSIRGSSSLRNMGDELISRRLSEYLTARGALKCKRNNLLGNKVNGYSNVTKI